jgi:hypothetical protein
MWLFLFNFTLSKMFAKSGFTFVPAMIQTILFNNANMIILKGISNYINAIVVIYFMTMKNMLFLMMQKKLCVVSNVIFGQ